jgi:hypothetical protein
VIWADDPPVPDDVGCHCGNDEPHDRSRCDERAAAEYLGALAADGVAVRETASEGERRAG